MVQFLQQKTPVKLVIVVPSRGIEPLSETPQVSVLSVKLRGQGAEGVGFEPTVKSLLQQFSGLSLSSAQAPLHFKLFSSCGGGGTRTHRRLFRPSEISNLLQYHYATPPSISLFYFLQILRKVPLFPIVYKRCNTGQCKYLYNLFFSCF